jgi:hypothetical protein
MAQEEELTPEEFETLARRLGLPLRPGAAPEMAKAYARLQAMAAQMRAERDIGAEPAHIFKP